jgi:hypothetical protein
MKKSTLSIFAGRPYMLGALLAFSSTTLAAPAHKTSEKSAVKPAKTTTLTHKANYVVGRCVDASGKPLSGVRVRIYGTSTAGRNASFNTKADASGRYIQRLPGGLYSVRDMIHGLRYNGRNYHLPLYLIGEDNSDFDSRQGQVANGIWKTSGLIARTKDATDESAYSAAISTYHYVRSMEVLPTATRRKHSRSS